jgi:hypothetical protein
MGKPRKIDIDDRIPCTKDGEFILPRCDDLEELWPALLTKALLKLNIFKVKHPSYSQKEENVDTNFIYAMTGYHAEIIQGLYKEDQIQNLLALSLNDDNFLNKKKYVLCLNLCKLNKTELYYEDVILQYQKKKETEKAKITNDIIEESSINEGSVDSGNDNEIKSNSNNKSKNNSTKNELSDNKKDSSKVFKKRGSSMMSKIFLQETTVNSNTNNDSIKNVNNLNKLNVNTSHKHSNKS